MDAEKTGALIRRLRLEKGMRQRDLAQTLHVSDKAVSKWERGAGCPDLAMLPALSEAFGVSADSLMAGEMALRDKDGGNMKRIKVYQCPTCGNLLTATGEASVTCCGRTLSPLPSQDADDAHRLTIQPVEDEWLVTFTHPMEKAHHLSFLLEVGYDRIVLLRLYPEGALEYRLPRLPGGKFFVGCTQHGMFKA